MVFKGKDLLRSYSHTTRHEPARQLHPMKGKQTGLITTGAVDFYGGIVYQPPPRAL